LPVSLTVETHDRIGDEAIEKAAYFVASEALANVEKHARASSAAISLVRRDRFLVIAVEDDGVGGADSAGGSGLRGLVDRIEALGGRLEVSSPSGGGTALWAELPYEP
jgi:signal transduction histidine kinase